MAEASIERIMKMEKALNKCRSLTETTAAQVDLLKNVGGDATELFGYYGSEDWYADRETTIPDEMTSDVLSEDSVYDEITSLRNLAFEMIELGTDILKNWI